MRAWYSCMARLLCGPLIPFKAYTARYTYYLVNVNYAGRCTHITRTPPASILTEKTSQTAAGTCRCPPSRPARAARRRPCRAAPRRPEAEVVSDFRSDTGAQASEQSCFGIQLARASSDLSGPEGSPEPAGDPPAGPLRGAGGRVSCLLRARPCICAVRRRQELRLVSHDRLDDLAVGAVAAAHLGRQADRQASGWSN